MERISTKNFIIIFIAIIGISLMYKIINVRTSNNQLINGAYVVGTVMDVSGGRGQFGVDVYYTHNRKVIYTTFYTYNIKGLNDSVKVKLLISKDNPSKYVKYIGLLK